MLFRNIRPFMCANLTFAAAHELVQPVPNCWALLPLNRLPWTRKSFVTPPASVAPPFAPRAVPPLFKNTDVFRYDPCRGFDRVSAPAALSRNAESSTRFAPVPPKYTAAPVMLGYSFVAYRRKPIPMRRLPFGLSPPRTRATGRAVSAI